VTNQPADQPEALPFVAPSRTLAIGDPLGWLKLGWRDLLRAPAQSLFYGVALTGLSYLVAGFTWRYGTLALYLGLATGFVFVGPVLAIGLYSISRRSRTAALLRSATACGGMAAPARRATDRGGAPDRAIGLGAGGLYRLHLLPRALRGVLAGLRPFLGIGSAVGAVFSAVVFAASAFSLPMVMDRRTDSITAVVTSVNAVLRNKRPMLVWGALIVASVVLGFLTLFVGFVVLFPLLGHATWHAYRQTIDASAWPVSAPNPRHSRRGP